MSEALRSASSGGRWSTINAVATMIVSFLFAGLTIRFLGLRDAGLAQFIAQLFTIATGVGGLSLGTAAARELSKADAASDIEEQRRILGLQFLILTCVGIAAVAIIGFGGNQILHLAHYGDASSGTRVFLVASAVALSIALLNSVAQGFYVSKQLYRLNSLMSLSSQFGLGFIASCVLSVYPSLMAYGIVLLLVNLGLFICHLYQIRNLVGGLPYFKWNSIEFGRLWRFSKWVYASNLLGMATSSLDRMIIVFLFGSKMLPIYNMGRKSYEVTHGFINSQVQFLFPLIARYETSEVRDGKSLAKTNFSDAVQPRLEWFVLLLACYAYSVSVCLLPTALRLLVSAEFADKVRPINFFFSLIGVVHSAAIVPYLIRYAQGDSRSNFVLAAVGSIIVGPLMFSGGLLFGFWGAVLGQIGIAIATVVFLTRISGRSGGFRSLGRTVLNAGIPLLLLGLCACTSAAGLFLGGGVVWEYLVGACVVLAFIPVALRLELRSAEGAYKVSTLYRAYKSIPMVDRAPNWLGRLVFGR